MEIIHDLIYILPELFILCSSLLLLVVGAFFKKRNNSKAISLSAIITIIVSLYLYVQYVPGNIVYLFDGALRSNNLIIFSKIIILVSSLFYLFINMGNINSKNSSLIKFEFPIIVLLSVLGMMLMISANDFITLFLSMELQSLSLYVLAAFESDNRKSGEAGIKYFTLGALATGIFLFGVSYIYGLTGSINFSELVDYFTNNVDHLNDNRLWVILGLVMIICAVCFKIAAAPFHMWAPDVYQGSSTLITAFFASVPKVASLIMVANILTYCFAPIKSSWEQIIIFIACLSMIVGAIGAVNQASIKRLLAYSSISHVGFILLALVKSDIIWLNLLQYLIIYLTLNLGVFSCLLMLKKNENNIDEVNDLSNLAKNYPVLALIITIFMLSMAGIPPLAGFFAKFYILKSLVTAGSLNFVIIIAIISSVISTYYYLRIIKIMYFSDNESGIVKIKSASLTAVALVLVIFNLAYFAKSDLIQEIIIKAIN